jgi:hypothetical protein
MEKELHQKQTYTAPILKRVEIDNEISLALESTPPTYESQNEHHSNDYFNQSPLNT